MQMIPSWSTTGTYTTIIPLLVFISISMGREGFDDWRRHRQDKEENNRTVKVARLNSSRISPVFSTSTTNLRTVATSSSSVDSATEPLVYEEIEWKKLRVGDIIKLEQNDWVPADILILNSKGLGNIAYIETMALDGETNLKTREPLPEFVKKCSTPEDLSSFKCTVTTEDPNIDLYNFEGTASIDGETFPLSSSHIVYRGSILRNTPSIHGLVVFSGEETKIRMNAIQNPRTKAPRLQQLVNKIVVFMVGVVLFLAVFCTVAAKIMYNNEGKKYWYLRGIEVGVVPNLMGFIIMYNTLIPLSLYVSMEIVKVVQMLMLQYDVDMYHEPTDTPMEAHTATINEELGQVSYIFSDKTGTLTENEMVFRKLSVGGYSWIHDLDIQMENQEDGEKLYHRVTQENKLALEQRKISTQNAGAASRPSNLSRLSRPSTDQILQQVVSLPRKSTSRPSNSRPSNPRKSNATMRPSGLTAGRPSTNSLARTSSVRSVWRSTAAPTKEQNIRSTLELLQYLLVHPNSVYARKAKFFILSIALCHTCVPDIDVSRNESGETLIENLEYQAASPDELALIDAARDMGFIMVDRQHKTMTIRTYPNGFDQDPVDELYEILDVVEFSSARKRMSILVRFPDGRVCVFCKGADNIILERLRLSDIAAEKVVEINRQTAIRKTAEAEMVVARNSVSNTGGIQGPRRSITGDRRSIAIDPRDVLGSVDDYLQQHANVEEEIEEIAEVSRRSMSLAARKRYGDESAISRTSAGNPSQSAATRLSLEIEAAVAPQKDDEFEEFSPDDRLVLNDSYVIEQTLEHIEEFSTEGLRTLLYSYRFMGEEEYTTWAKDYSEAKTSLTDRQKKIEDVAERIEVDLDLCGATAIEDKLQDGVPEAIDKLRRAGIKLWMLTGDKRETAINIGYSCRLIKDYSTVIVLRSDEDDVAAKIAVAMQELERGNVAHCVVVVDGATLAGIEQDMTLMTLFIELGVKANSVICCRASPSQKAAMVTAVRKKVKSSITLAIGDGANDIAMIQSADVGIGITGREGLQAARSSDYAIAQFRFLLKLLLVHGRWNYVRTCKYILGTFYKEIFFYLTQAVYQRNVMFTGSSLYETWSLSMFNTLFTSLPVICIGIMEKDLKASTLIAVPELYKKGQNNEGFDFWIFMGWIIIGASQSVLVSFITYYVYGYNLLKENSVFPFGVMLFTTVVVMCTVKLQLLEMHSKTFVNFAVIAICVGGWFIWNMFLSYIYGNSPSKIYNVHDAIFNYWGHDLAWWMVLLCCIVVSVVLDMMLQSFRVVVRPTDTDTFQELEQYPPVHRRLQKEAFSELQQGWRTGKFSNNPDAFAYVSGEMEYDYENNRYRPASSMTNRDSLTSSNSSHGYSNRTSQHGASTDFNLEELDIMKPKRKRDKIKQKLRFAPQPTTLDDERAIQEILRRRQQETDEAER